MYSCYSDPKFTTIPPLSYQQRLNLPERPNWILPCGAKTHFSELTGYMDPRPQEKSHFPPRFSKTKTNDRPMKKVDENKLLESKGTNQEFRNYKLAHWPLPPEKTEQRRQYTASCQKMQLNEPIDYHDADRLNIDNYSYRKKVTGVPQPTFIPTRPQTAFITVEKEMTRKGRVQSSYIGRRNGIPDPFPGDHPYGVPTCSKSFFKDNQGGLIPGSTSFNIGKNSRRKNFGDFTMQKNTDWHKRPRR